MAEPHDLADPDFEPSDADLTELSKRAFAGVRREHALALEELRARIEVARSEVLQRLAARTSTRGVA